MLDTNPNNQYSRWYLADHADPTIPSASVRATGIACYHYSDYSYLGALGPSRPHPWSYFKTVGNCPPGDAGCNFQNAIQLPGYYPSKDAMGNFNNHPGTLDNHHFFINFPDDKDPVFTPAVRAGIRTRINSFLDLTPVQSPESGNYWTKLPVHAKIWNSQAYCDLRKTISSEKDSVPYCKTCSFTYEFSKTGWFLQTLDMTQSKKSQVLYLMKTFIELNLNEKMLQVLIKVKKTLESLLHKERI